jgi:hypothetical protein
MVESGRFKDGFQGFVEIGEIGKTGRRIKDAGNQAEETVQTGSTNKGMDGNRCRNRNRALFARRRLQKSPGFARAWYKSLATRLLHDRIWQSRVECWACRPVLLAARCHQRGTESGQGRARLGMLVSACQNVKQRMAVWSTWKARSPLHGLLVGSDVCIDRALSTGRRQRSRAAQSLQHRVPCRPLEPSLTFS